MHSDAHQRKSRLTMPNNFPARDRTFISKLADDLHLYVTWDEYDEEDETQNIVTWRFPGELEEPLPEGNGSGSSSGNGSGTPEEEDENDDAWEDEDDEESKAAVDRVLGKYERAKIS